MLFNYRYVAHDIEKLQDYLDHLVKEVWCKAQGDFSVNLLHKDLKDIVIAVENDDSVKMKLLKPIRDIFNLFKDLPPDYKAELGSSYDANNNIEGLCSNAPGNHPITYDEIALIDEELAKQLKDFYKDLWSRVINLEAVKGKTGNIDDHYVAFVKVNNEDKCPYCGFGGIKGQYHTKREAYDHYFPKGTYPFSSVNFKNLALMCHECNSSYKLAKDPTQNLNPINRKNGGGRRKAFYSYAANPSGISFSVQLHTKDVERLHPKEIKLTITAPGRDEEVESWKDVFGIEERYKAMFCGKNDGKYWLTQATEECKSRNITSQEIIQMIQRIAAHSPWAQCNFLKSPFLLACQTAGLIR